MLSDEEKQAIRKKVREQSGPWHFDLELHAEEIERAVIAKLQVPDAIKLLQRVAQSTTESIAAKASQKVPEFNGWYCAQCQCGVDPSEVTFHETHRICGRYIADDEPPKVMTANKQAAAIPAGYVLAPTDPTRTMLDAGVAMALQVSVHGEGGWSKYLTGLYKQMLSAAPKPEVK